MGELFPDPVADPGPVVAVARVAVAVPVDKPLDYLIPDEFADQVETGRRVLVPVGPRRVPGFVMSRDTRPDDGKLKAIFGVLEERPCLSAVTLDLGLWVARWYGAAPGEALQAVVPAAVRRAARGRQEWWVHLADRAAAERLLEENRDKTSWTGRRKVLRQLLEEEAGLRMSELLRMTGVTASPVQTLERNGVVERERVAVSTDPFEALRPVPTQPPELTEEQATALDGLLPDLRARRFGTHLLHGVTGSGKTEVYLRLIEETLEQGRGAILMVPEIVLTPQTIERLLGRIPNVAVLHSGLSDSDRARQWERLRTSEVRVAVGPRSAVFAPIEDLGLIILDEEHETTFKQQSQPRYHAREAARHRAAREGAIVVLGSATPSLESEALCRSGAAERHRLTRRVAGRPMPEIKIVDMRHEKPVGPGGMFSHPLVHSMAETLERGEQVLLFLNRRGFSTTVLCRLCGWRGTCRNCDINLTHYQGSDRLLCHYCGHEEAPPTHCPDCAGAHLRYGGFGTEKVAESARALFPEYNVARMDGETLRRRGAPERLYNELRDGTIRILVGTQVVAKGFDIPGIALVGVVSADTALLIPDFRSAERTFQLLCQVAGRAGRGDVPGRVLVQSYTPGNYAIRAAALHDHDGFATEELRHREAFGYPPAGHLLRVVIEASTPEVAARHGVALREELAAHPAIQDGTVTVRGPAPCPIPLLKGQHRHHLLLRAMDPDVITGLVSAIPRKSGPKLRVLLDRDPVSVM